MITPAVVGVSVRRRRSLQAGVDDAILLGGFLAMAVLCGGCLKIDAKQPFACACAPNTEEVVEAKGRLETHVKDLAEGIGERSYRRLDNLDEAADWLEKELRLASQGIERAVVRPHGYTLSPEQRGEVDDRATKAKCDDDPELEDIDKHSFRNVELVLRGNQPRSGSVVIGAHYDSDSCESRGCNPGADDNASGVAALIELASRLAKAEPLPRDLVFVGFTNEEEPFFHTKAMGSYEYATRQGPTDVVAMLSLEMLGYYSDEQGSQEVPPVLGWLAGASNTGNFIAFVANRHSSDLLMQALESFRGGVSFPAQGILAWQCLPGVGWSDHWSYWQRGVPALMVTDTALNRNHCYHRDCDRPERLDYARMAKVVSGLETVIVDLGRKGVATLKDSADTNGR